ncbi:MAG TPA: tyrosine-type recombinase/integrase [Pseudonocardiaceae bacterium]
MERAVDLPGAAHLMLVDGVVHLDPAPAVFEAMLEGWTIQQRARFLKAVGTIQPRVDLVRRLARFSNQYPWQWEPAEVEAFIVSLSIAPSTARNYQNTLRLFCEYTADPRYGWPAKCHERFGAVPRQVLHEWNTIAHVAEYEGNPGRRPLTYDEVQRLFDAADGRVEEIRARHRKGAIPAMRDSALLKTVYAFGLRRQEAVGLDVCDLRRNPKVAAYGRYGGLFVRWGKSSKGSPPKRRGVFTVRELDWIVPVLDHYLTEVRPLLAPTNHPAMWVTERGGRISRRRLNRAFEAVRELAGLPSELDLHSLRHSFVTHLIEFDYPEKFVQDQCGHAWGSTTALYSGVSEEYRNRLVQRALSKHDGALWEDQP